MVSRSGVHSKTQLLQAAITGNLLRLKALVAGFSEWTDVGRTVAGATDLNGLSALHFAAAEGKLDVCKYLIDDLKLDVDAKDGKSGATPLHHASLGAHLSTAVYLLEKGANPDMRNDSGFTPLHYVALEGHIELVHLLLSRGVNVDSLSDLGTPLNRASGKGKHEVVKVLLDHHANPNIFFNRLFTPLSSSIVGNSLACVELLIKAGADPNAGSCGVMPLALAIYEGEIAMIECLLKAGADPSVTNGFGLTPIEIAAVNDQLEAVQILFPVTSPISTFPDWSIGGIMRHVHAEAVRAQRKLKEKEILEVNKSKGEDAFHKRDYLTAIFWYTGALELDPFNAILLSNRSLCWARLKEGDRALSDAESCIALTPEWPKAYYRAGAAWSIFGKFDQAANAFSKGLKLDPKNKELWKAFQEAVDAQIKH